MNADAATPQAGRERSNQNLVPGRKSLTGEQGKHSPVVNVRVTEHTRDGLREVADNNDSTVTKVVRQALDDAQQYYVLFEQRFEGDLQWVRFDKALTLDRAEEMFTSFKRLAQIHGYRRVQIRRGRDLLVQEWRNQEFR